MANPERDIADKILTTRGASVASLGLRFDRVVVRVLGRLRAFVEAELPDGETLVVTITAPIRLPGRMADDLERAIGERLSPGKDRADRSLDLLGNSIRVRRLIPSRDHAPKFVGFVHNRGSDPMALLDLAEAWLGA